jgi:hypothetical protein
VAGPLGGLAEALAERGVGDRRERLAALVHRLALELGGAVLGDDDVHLVARRRDHGAGVEPRHDPGAELVADGDRGRQAQHRPVVEVEGGAGHEVLVTTDPRVLHPADGVGDHLSVDVDAHRGVDRDHRPVAADRLR